MKQILPFLLFFVSLFVACKEQGKKEEATSASATDKPVLPSELTEENACLLSQIAYTTNIDAALSRYMPGWTAVWNATELGGNHAFVATNGREYALSIRGSLISFTWAAFQNWIYQDLHVVSQQKWGFTNDSSKAKLSQGAYDGWQNLCNMIDKKNGAGIITLFRIDIERKYTLTDNRA